MNGTFGILEERRERMAQKRSMSMAHWHRYSSHMLQPFTNSSRYTLSDALAVAVWLNVLIRQSRYIGMANIAQSVNVISPLMTTKEGIIKQTTWWPLLLFSKYMRGHAVAVNLCCSDYDGPTEPAWIRGTLDTPWLDVSAAASDDGFLNLAVVNVNDQKDFEADLEGVDSTEVQIYTVTGSGPTVTNMEGEQNVSVRESIWNGTGRFKFPKHSFTMLRWKHRQ